MSEFDHLMKLLQHMDRNQEIMDRSINEFVYIPVGIVQTANRVSECLTVKLDGFSNILDVNHRVCVHRFQICRHFTI